MAGRVDILYFLENLKKVKIEVTGQKKNSDVFSGPVIHFLLFSTFLYVYAPEYINPSCHFVFYEILF